MTFSIFLPTSRGPAFTGREERDFTKSSFARSSCALKPISQPEHQKTHKELIFNPNKNNKALTVEQVRGQRQAADILA